MTDGKVKIENIHIRISETQKEIITNYVKEKKIKLSDFIRDTCINYILEERKKELQNG